MKYNIQQTYPQASSQMDLPVFGALEESSPSNPEDSEKAVVTKEGTEFLSQNRLLYKKAEATDGGDNQAGASTSGSASFSSAEAPQGTEAFPPSSQGALAGRGGPSFGPQMRPDWGLPPAAGGVLSQGVVGRQAHALGGFLRHGEWVHKGLNLEENGGIKVPEAIQAQIFERLEDLSPLRRHARVTRISRSRLDVMRPKTQAEVKWALDREAPREETQAPTLSTVSIPVFELYACPRATQAMIEDAQINVVEWLVHTVTADMAKAENHAFLYGDGEKQPKGLLTYPFAPEAERTEEHIGLFLTGAERAFDREKGAHVLLEMAHSIPTRYLKGSVWVMARSTFAAIRTLTQGLDNRYIFQPTLELGREPHLLGYPVILCDEMPSLQGGGAHPHILFGNMNEAYQIVDRHDIAVMRDPYSHKPYVEFYVTKRVGGALINSQALKGLCCNQPQE